MRDGSGFVTRSFDPYIRFHAQLMGSVDSILEKLKQCPFSSIIAPNHLFADCRQEFCSRLGFANCGPQILFGLLARRGIVSTMPPLLPVEIVPGQCIFEIVATGQFLDAFRQPILDVLEQLGQRCLIGLKIVVELFKHGIRLMLNAHADRLHQLADRVAQERSCVVQITRDDS